MYRGQKQVYHPMRDTLRTIYYWTLNNEKINLERVWEVFAESCFKPRDTKHRIQTMFNNGWLKFIGDRIFLTDKGLRYVEKKERLITMTLYGKLLVERHMTFDRAQKIFIALAHRVVGPTFTDQTWTILRRLKREGVIDYANKRIWVVKKIKLREE